MPEVTPAPGAALTAAREARGLSVDDVAESTRIRATLVRDIESDRYDRCGGPFYARGHLRAIANAVGLDPAPLVDEFDRQQRAAGGAHLQTAMPSREPGEERRDDRSGARWPVAMIAVLAVVAIALGASLVVDRNDSSDGDRSAAARPRPSTAASRPATPAPRATSTGPPQVAAVPPGVNLRVRVTRGNSWISVSGSRGQALFTGVLQAGAVKDFRDQRALRVKFGNSRAVSLILNNKDLGSPPGCGSIVCSVVFDETTAAG